MTTRTSPTDATASELAARSNAGEAGEPEPRPIVFFDGVCGLCNHLVDFILAKDKQGRILLAPLQGETAQQRLPAAERENVDTIIMLIEGRTYRRSAAVVRILWKLGGLWSFLGSLLWLVPLPLRNLAYRIVAWSRYKLFGKKATCRLPTPEERGRLLP